MDECHCSLLIAHHLYTVNRPTYLISTISATLPNEVQEGKVDALRKQTKQKLLIPITALDAVQGALAVNRA